MKIRISPNKFTDSILFSLQALRPLGLTLKTISGPWNIYCLIPNALFVGAAFHAVRNNVHILGDRDRWSILRVIYARVENSVYQSRVNAAERFIGVYVGQVVQSLPRTVI